ncbi:hypothetical protein AMJ44_00460 [candidate division WOR-1 bacterium DG_54_3]|uniref:Uncharacterized protein n=1 Tax=candidate division WOR-1 bacterium DG_54_3 TaxID=1703775 RepID=A0A0S7Y7Z0_UNCSA|nr:MAG: hypothetical protein AMJ44_00460 [candidate division WOR-1 bacterium DG_54_3]
MRFKQKVAIFLLALFLTFVGFSLVASPSAVELVKVGKQAGYEIIANVLAEAGAGASLSTNMGG